MGVGDLYGARRVSARDWFRRTTAAHRVAAWVIGSAALFACEIFYAVHQRIPLSTVAITIAAVTYVSFTVIAIMRWPPWLSVTVTTAGAAASIPTGPGDGSRSEPGARRKAGNTRRAVGSRRSG